MTERRVFERCEDETLFEGTPFRVIERLGAGGMGEVFAVEHRELGRRLAVKVLSKKLLDEPQAVDRMRLEAEALSRLNHPNILAVEGFHTARDGRPFIVTELLRGSTLASELASKGALRVRLAIAYAVDLLSALEAAHRIAVVHRDVKPANIFLAVGDDGRKLLKLIDFGIARVLPGAPAVAPAPLSLPTRTGALVGTPRFASPEGAVGRRVDERADLYAAALVLYMMLAGRGPFDHFEGEHALLGAHANFKPRPPSRYAAEPVPAELDAIVLKALEKNPEDRFQTAGEFQNHLEHLNGLLVRPPGWLGTTAFDPTSLSSPASTATAHGTRLKQSDCNSRPASDYSRRAALIAVVLITVAFSAAAATLVTLLWGPE